MQAKLVCLVGIFIFICIAAARVLEVSKKAGLLFQNDPDFDAMSYDYEDTPMSYAANIKQNSFNGAFLF